MVHHGKNSAVQFGQGLNVVFDGRPGGVSLRMVSELDQRQKALSPFVIRIKSAIGMTCHHRARANGQIRFDQMRDERGPGPVKTLARNVRLQVELIEKLWHARRFHFVCDEEYAPRISWQEQVRA